jgi:hypothetical protein
LHLAQTKAHPLATVVRQPGGVHARAEAARDKNLMEHKGTVERTDLPKPWEDEPITRAAWEANRQILMNAAVGHGFRPDGWWLYERNMTPPEPKLRQARILYEMGEFKGGELAKMIGWFRDYYDVAINAAHHWGIPDRTRYWRWEDIPPALIEQWDRE